MMACPRRAQHPLRRPGPAGSRRRVSPPFHAGARSAATTASRPSSVPTPTAAATDDVETYFLSAEGHHRRRGGRPYDKFLTRRCISMQVQAAPVTAAVAAKLRGGFSRRRLVPDRAEDVRRPTENAYFDAGRIEAEVAADATARCDRRQVGRDRRPAVRVSQGPGTATASQASRRRRGAAARRGAFRRLPGRRRLFRARHQPIPAGRRL